jgi:hypothetical protein
MRKFIVLSLIVVFFIGPYNTDAAGNGYEVVAKLNNGDITLYAKKKVEFYQDFKIDFKGTLYSRPFWINVSNPTYAPQVYYEDINNDEKKELVIILTKGYGTGVLEQEVNVFNVDNNRFVEVLVDNPMAIVNRNIRSSLSQSKAELTIGKKHYVINVKKLELIPETIFDEMNFGSIIKYEVKSNKLVAILHPQIAPGVFVGSIIITYDYFDKMYQAKSIEFQQ